MKKSEQSFEQLFRKATGGLQPFPFQRQLASNRWPDVLNVPTGMGKTAAVGISWIYGRLAGDPETPRRLIYCLPMRALVEQTVAEFRKWLDNLDALGSPGEEGKIPISVLMGGESDLRTAPWARHPGQSQVLIGTQDMLLSRALMRGYGMSRFQWPVHFGLLHSDALWVFDEVQLMGPALATSAQLEGFRRDRNVPSASVESSTDQGFGMKTNSFRPARSLWVSATLQREWLATVDFRTHVPSLQVQEVGPEDVAIAGERLAASKTLFRAGVRLDAETAKGKAKAYLDSLAALVTEKHVEGTRTLVIVNRVDRAQGLMRRLQKAGTEVELVLVHARFREAERRALNEALRTESARGQIVIATQAVEAGVDLSSRTLVTELAPWDSLVQRFGRCNRRGEYPDGANVFWIDIESGIGEAPPYEDEALDEARQVLLNLDSAASDDLPPVTKERMPTTVLRWKDLTDLFDTDPDLSGFDVDIAPYIRDTGSPQVWVFWRTFDSAPDPDEPAPERHELCAFSMPQMRQYLKKKRKNRSRPAWVRDSLAGRWVRLTDADRLRPGSTLMLNASEGGYNSTLGAEPEGWSPVIALPPEVPRQDETHDGDPGSRLRRFVLLSAHTRGVVGQAAAIGEAIGLTEGELESLLKAALWHDVGKAHPAFQTALLDVPFPPEEAETELWAKSSGGRPLRYRIERNGVQENRRHFRHELASMLAWLTHGAKGAEEVDLIAYLILSHHGRVRMGIRALPTEPTPPDDRLFARGVHEDDRLPALTLDGHTIPETELRLDLIRLGLGPMGPSWTERTRRLLSRYGPFRLARLEALLRIADWKASEEEEG